MTTKRPKVSHPPFIYREGTGLSQTAFAALLGVAPEHLSRMENGHALTRPGTQRLGIAIAIAKSIASRPDYSADPEVTTLLTVLLDT